MQNSLQTIRNIGRTYRNIGRFRKILSVLLANGFGNFFRDLRMLASLGLNIKDVENSQSSPSTNEEWAERLRRYSYLLASDPDAVFDSEKDYDNP